LVLGEDVTSTAPRVALALRQGARGKANDLAAKKNVPEWQAIALADLVQKEKYPVFIATPDATRLDDIAHRTWHAVPEEIARLGFAIAHRIDSGAPAADSANDETLAAQVAEVLMAAKRPLIVSGTGAQSLAVIEAATNIAKALQVKNPAVEISLAVPEVNSIGAAMMGAGKLDDALEILAKAEVDHVVLVLENDLYRRAPKAKVNAALKNAKMIVLDHQMTATAALAHLILPAASVFEGDGTFISMEGRAQRHFQVYDPVYYNKDISTTEAWRWLANIKNEPWVIVDEITAACSAALPPLQRIIDAAPSAKFRVNGMKLAREPHRYSGRTAMRANISVHEPRQPQDRDTALNFSMEGYNGIGSADRPAALLPYAWAPGWNSPSAWNKFQSEIGGHQRGGDAGVQVFASGGDLPYFPASVASFSAPAGSFRVVALHRHFGEEELSSRAQPIVDRAPQALAVINAADAKRLGINGHVTIAVEGETLTLATYHSESLPQGVIGLPAGFAGVPLISAQSIAQIRAGG
jgi:NADH-quinone oxidoreductase subunit G